MAKEVVTTNLTASRVATLKKEDPEKYAKLPDTGRKIEFKFNFGETIEEAINLYKGDIVRSFYKGHLLFTLQGKARSLMAVGKTDAEIQAIFDAWKPGMAPTRKSSVEKERDRLTKLSPEEQALEVQKLKALLAEFKS